MTRLPLFILVSLLALAASAPPAAAERVVASLSNHRVQVSSSFVGDVLVLFGLIERDPDNQRTGRYDIVATVSGPRQNLVTFKKSRVLGIWVNTDSRVFDNAPAYLAVLTSRPLEAIANAETLRRLQLGLNNVVLLQRAAVTIADSSIEDPFRVNFIKLREKQHLYQEQKNGVNFLTPVLYSAPIPLPAESPIGSYDVDVRLFADGAAIARTNTAFEVYKSGFEQLVTTSARDYGFFYGLATAMMAVVTGWFASVVFRRD
jgi:uncharacterized protein (TIGR02186 family)